MVIFSQNSYRKLRCSRHITKCITTQPSAVGRSQARAGVHGVIFKVSSMKYIGATLVGISFYWFIITTIVYLIGVAGLESTIGTSFYLASVFFCIVLVIVGRSIYPEKESTIEDGEDVSSFKELFNLNLMKLNVIGWVYVYSALQENLWVINAPLAPKYC